MIANFFQSLDAQGVEHLLISGQASVLYGAATFSEDIDLWLKPTAQNAQRFLAALHLCAAQYYKLTPPMSLQHLKRGHGFHFLLPAPSGDHVFLDVMGVPPRAGDFGSALANATHFDTEWGRLPTIGIKELVEMKKTQRLEDYAVISRLALVWLNRPGRALSAEDFRWAAENAFTLGELRGLVEEHSTLAQAWVENAPVTLREYVRQILSSGDTSESAEETVSAWMHQRITALQQADRRYWKDIIAELKRLRATGQLIPEDTPV
jgi:hypothetical protein